MRGVTVEPLVRHDARKRWAVEDLLNLPDDGHRYEIFDGSLLVSPMPAMRHVRVTEAISRVVGRQAPDSIFVTCAGAGVNLRGGRSYFIPDVTAIREAGIDDNSLGVASADVVLVVEVLSPSNARNDLILKRHEYAADKIPAYWIVDPEKQMLTVLEHDGEHYREVGIFSERFTVDNPFPISIDLAEIF
jgi:Uma2 family endonuclease